MHLIFRDRRAALSGHGAAILLSFGLHKELGLTHRPAPAPTAEHS